MVFGQHSCRLVVNGFSGCIHSGRLPKCFQDYSELTEVIWFGIGGHVVEDFQIFLGKYTLGDTQL